MGQQDAAAFLKRYQLTTSLRTRMPTKLRGDEIDLHLSEMLSDASLTETEIAQAHEMRAAVGIEIDATRHHADRLIGVLPSVWQERLRSIPVGTLPDLKVNAATVKSDTGEPIVVIASGLSTFLFEVANWCTLATPMADEEPETTLSDATRHIFQWAMFYVTRQPEWFPQGLVRSKSPARRNLIGGLWTNGLNFVLGHEYGHALLGHLDTAQVKTIAGDGGASLRAYDFSYQMEFDADATGAEIALEFSRSLHGGWIGAGTAGTELALRTLWLIEQLFPSRSPSRTHPTSQQRVERMYHQWRQTHGDWVVDDLASLTRYFTVTAEVGKAILAEHGVSPSARIRLS